MIIVKCDRCGKKIKNPKKQITQHLTIYSTPLRCKYEKVDLCMDCAKEMAEFMNLAESYFMNNKDDAIDIFEKSKYYRE